ncbi:MAG: TonB-dependent receptor plug domain-containing protein, partial [Novosphingobium sp.]
MKTEPNHLRRLMLMWTVAASAFAPAALAQGSSPADATGPVAKTGQSNQVDEIVVTANKREESLSRVPISIAAYTAETMDRQGVRSAEDIARLTPGVSFRRDTFGSGSGTSISIRGISSSSGAATTGIYIDDTAIQIRSNAQTAFGSALPEIFDLDRVEILRGPQGTLFGAGAQGGVVRFITPTPSLTKQSIYARTEAAVTDNGAPSYEAGVAVGAPLVEDKIGVRLSGYYRHSGGFVDRKPFNTATPNSTAFYKDVNDVNTLALRAAVLVEPAPGIKFLPSVVYQRQTVADSGAFWDSLSNPGNGQFISGYQLAQKGVDRFVIPSLKVSIDLGSVELTSVSSYFDRRGSAIQDYTNVNTAFIFEEPTPFIPGWVAPGHATAKQGVFSQEIRLGSTDPQAKIRWTVGAFYSNGTQNESFHIEDDTVARLLPITAIFGIPLTEGRYLFVAGNDSREKQYALFGQ